MTTRHLPLEVTSDCDMAREFSTKRQARLYAARRGIRGTIIRHPAYRGEPASTGGYIIRDTDYRDSWDMSYVM